MQRDLVHEGVVMTTHLYCVLPGERHGTCPAGLTGVGGAPVRILAMPGMVAWVSDAELGGAADRPPIALESVRAQSLFDGVRAHDGVVEAALETGATPLPARFGQRFNGDDACAAAIAARGAAVESLLASLQGHVEMTLIITPSTRRMIRELQPVFLPELAGDAERGESHRYLDTLRTRAAGSGGTRRAIDALEQRLDQAARPFSRRTAVHEQLANAPPLRTVSHLVPREAIDRYSDAVNAVPTGRELRFFVIGPRAPYSFSALEPGTGGSHGMKLAD
jgi:hypothetical protein